MYLSNLTSRGSPPLTPPIPSQNSNLVLKWQRSYWPENFGFNKTKRTYLNIQYNEVQIISLAD